MSQLNTLKSSATLVVTGGHLITPVAERFATLSLNGQTIASLSQFEEAEQPGAEVLSADGCYVTPGLIDLQVNGGPECNLWGDPDEAEIINLRKTMAHCGVTSFLPTLITDEIEHLKKNISLLTRLGARVCKATGNCGGQAELLSEALSDSAACGLARMLGLHLEGPFLSREKPGVHPQQWVRQLTKDAVADLVTDAVALITLAPETDPGGESIKFLTERGVCVSVGHSNATLAQAKEAFRCGARLMTHTFNALPPLAHRAPGAVTAALLDPQVFCCVIADGLHVDPAIVELIIKIKGVERTILVTDRAQVGTSNGGLVGSSLLLDQAVRNVVEWEIATFPEAIRMASYNPAIALGVEPYLGLLQSGHAGDLVIWDKQTLCVKQVVLGGKLVAVG